MKFYLCFKWIFLLFIYTDLPIFHGFEEIDQENVLPLHPNSPPEADETMMRKKRQAYQVYSGNNEISISGDRGVAESGPWGAWTPERECSRTCGGGIKTETRACNGECTGSSKRYLSCNLEPCPEGTIDFRAQQCASFNDKPLDGNYFKWLPYSGKNKCELTCKPETANFYYKWADKVIDGTRCDNFGDEICVDGYCLPVGCDGAIMGEAKNDKCGICNGDNSQCKSVEGVFDERQISPGYHDIVVLPLGATSIKVEEVRPTSNSLAIKNSTGHFYLNGDFKINLLEKNIRVAGTTFKYRKSNEEGVTEQLTANGPLKEPITISLLLQRGGQRTNSVIKYEYSVPLQSDVKYLYRFGEWTGCSVTCGKGVQKRDVYCVDQESNQRVDDESCEGINATKPEFEKPCETVDCEPEWYAGDWETCSESCGNSGLQLRVVYCHKIFADGRRMTIEDGNCTNTGIERPDLRQNCNRFSCPEWHYGPWSACSQQCGSAKQYRSVTCRSEKEGEEGKLLSAEACSNLEKEDSERECNLGPCEGLKFQTTDWELCQRCNETEESRNVTCVDKNGRPYPLEKCLNANVTKIPIDVRPCATTAPCVYEWHTSQWSKCSSECGHGHRKRRTFCAIAEVGEIKPVDNELCIGDQKPIEKEECVNEEKCTGIYFTGPWDECTEKCSGGKQKRMVVCLNYDHKPVPEWCDESTRPVDEQDCNTDPCPTCTESEFGCCADNVTFAKGSDMEGCTNCTSLEFGCCADNTTVATGPGGEGCPEYIQQEGSGEEPPEEEEKDKKLCEVKNEETGDMIKIDCASTIAPSPALVATDELDKMMFESDANETGLNITIHCSKTEFGCCPDWNTPAEGKEFEGCATYVLGTCNGTKFGCCPDGITLSRGPNLEGCGEPTCSGSLFGCCKDRKTIAFGPHYSGCERSSFPCELSQYGCCPDGDTAALGHNGTGCGVSCLTTKFGCCPDGLTQAKGVNNEGCGCEFAQYGCCPDGKISAKGPGYFGCPEGCAQSKHGCCPDGQTMARGPNREGCPCQYTRWGCCPDGETTALGPVNEGCDDCRYAKYGCCLDGVTKAIGPDFAGCPSTTPPPLIVGGTVSPSAIVACGLPQDQGYVCHPGYKLVWFYDVHEGRCSQFWYGGCGGNENRFSNQDECEQVCVEPPELGRCYLPKIEGPQRCSQLAARYWYDYNTKQCSAFWWRGCLGNANNFPSFEDCVRFCSFADSSQVSPGILHKTVVLQQPTQLRPFPPQTIIRQTPAQIVDRPLPHHQPQFPIVSAPYPQPIDQETKTRDVCNLRVDVGKCEGHFENWYYEVASGSCEKFQYSGCGGNGNRFHVREQCEELCMKEIPSHQLLETAATHQFVSVPAGSNPNLALVCEVQKDSGSCKQFSTKWFYNKADGTCNRFHYGGCEGNANRFETEQECKTTCGDFTDACSLPLVIGPCAGKNERYHFDISLRQCKRFEYSGCLGNNNNFRSFEECKARCPS